MLTTNVHPRPGSLAEDREIIVRPFVENGQEMHLIPPTRDVEPVEVDWAEGNLADAETIVLPARKRKRVRVWQDRDGRWFRNGGRIYYRRSSDGVYRFVIYLCRGANQDDFNHLLQAIELAKAGRFARHGWEPAAESNGGPSWFYGYSRLYQGARDAAWLSTTADPSRQLVPCTDGRCTQVVHLDHGDDHEVDSIEADRYSISVSRYFDRDGADELYSVQLRTTGVVMSLAGVASLISDLRWAATACRHANETSTEHRPWHPDYRASTPAATDVAQITLADVAEACAVSGVDEAWALRALMTAGDAARHLVEAGVPLAGALHQVEGAAA